MTTCFATEADRTEADRNWDAAIQAEIQQLRRDTLETSMYPYFVEPAVTDDGVAVPGYTFRWVDSPKSKPYPTEDDAWAAAWEDAKKELSAAFKLVGYFWGMTEYREIDAVDNLLNRY